MSLLVIKMKLPQTRDEESKYNDVLLQAKMQYPLSHVRPFKQSDELEQFWNVADFSIET